MIKCERHGDITQRIACATCHDEASEKLKSQLASAREVIESIAKDVDDESVSGGWAMRLADQWLKENDEEHK